MKRKIKTLRYIGTVTIASIIGISAFLAVTAEAETETDATIAQADAFIERYEHDTTCINRGRTSDSDSDSLVNRVEPETVSLSYSEWKEQKTQQETETEPNYYEMDVWTLGSTLYGISELDTTRTLKLITYEGYGDSPLSYYVACCCWVRCQEEYFGFCDLYESFGGLDACSYGGQYGAWMDELEYSDYAVEALRECYLSPTYVTSCNGCEIPDEWIYAEWTEDGFIYVWEEVKE